MASELTATERSDQNDSDQIAKHTNNPQANKICKGMTVYKRDTGMAFEVVNVSHANGIKALQLALLGNRVAQLFIKICT